MDAKTIIAIVLPIHCWMEQWKRNDRAESIHGCDPSD